MIRIQSLKEPKKTSGEKLEKNKSILFKGVHITNKTDKILYIDFYKRKIWKKKETK